MIFSPLRYAMTYVLVAMASILAIALIIMATGVNIGSAAVQLVPVIAAAMVEGQRHAKGGAAQPSGAQMWRAAVAMTGMGAALLILWTVAQLSLGGGAVRELPVPVLISLAVLVAVYLPVNRWFYAMGFRSAARG